MKTYIILIDWTDRGIRAVKNSPARLIADAAEALRLGGEIVSVYLTTSGYDSVLVCRAPDDAVVARLALQIGQGGNVRTTTLRAFDEAEYRELIASL